MIWQFLALLAVHWVGDFVLQTNWQASNKSKRNDALMTHAAVYTFCLMLTVPFIFPDSGTKKWFVFLGVNCMAHFWTDFVTSRASAYFFNKQNLHNFFVVVGYDQLIHQVTLAVTMMWFL